VTEDRQPPYPPLDVPPYAGPTAPLAWTSLPRRRKFVHRYGTHITLFVITLLTTSMAGGCQYLGFEVSTGATLEPITSWTTFVSWEWLSNGLWFSVPLLLILGAHEFGHYAYCRRHDVDATLPYFIPAPIPLTGTFGAVIRIREPFPSKRALFDIGVAGPIAGFVVLVPFLFWGLALSQQVEFPEGTDVVFFGEPLLLKAIAWLRFGTLPDGQDITLHPLGFAAWWGMLATALNLLPFGQLDGGHLAYAVLGRRSRYVSALTLVAAVLLTSYSTSWAFFTVMLIVMAFLFGVGHPRVIDEDTPLSPGRRLVAVFAAIMFVVCFTPVPIEMFVPDR
jgi:membrane-associated protease RseP (regulator of RpoE activity)